MKKFTDWMKRKRISEDSDSPDIFGFDGNIKHSEIEDQSVDYDQTTSDLIKVLLNKYREETISFIENIASRGDNEVKEHLDKINQTNKDNNKLEQPQVKDNEDEYVIPNADGAQSDSSSED